MSAVLTWQRLRDLKLSELDDAGDGWGAVSERADANRVRVEAEMTGALLKTQESESARSAARRLKRLGRNYEYIHTECGLIRSTVNGLSHELSAPQRRLKEALDDAASLSYTVHNDGSVTYPAGVKILSPASRSREALPSGTITCLNTRWTVMACTNRASIEEHLDHPALTLTRQKLRT